MWHYRNADPDFGQWQAVELTDQLENLLTTQPVEVVKGSHIVEVKPKHVTKVGGVSEGCSLADGGVCW